MRPSSGLCTGEFTKPNRWADIQIDSFLRQEFIMIKTHGLTLGKFAPLHKGHQLVIEMALAEMDAVTVIIYDAPETTSIPLNIRSNWLRKLYPQVKVIDAWDGPTEVGDTPEIKRKHEKYILNEACFHSEAPGSSPESRPIKSLAQTKKAVKG